MNILQVGKYYPPVKGGIETHVQTLSHALAQRAEVSSVTVIVSNTNHQLKIEEEEVQYPSKVSQKKVNESNNDIIKKIKIIKLPRIKFLSIPFNFSLFYYLKKKRDIVHIQLPNPSAMLAYFLAKPKTNLIVTWQADTPRFKFAQALLQPLTMYILKKSKAIIVTHPLSPLCSSEFKDKTVVIPLGIPHPPSITNTSKRLPYSQIKNSQKVAPYLIFIGRLVKYKGVKYLISAMKNVPTILYIIGDGPEKTSLQKMVHNLHLEKKVIFLGELEESKKNEYLENCAMLILPSIGKNEAFGLVQLEAMKYAKPVISTKLHTGVEFVNEHKKTGLIVPPKNSLALADAINMLLEHKDLAKKYGQFGKKRAHTKFNANIMGEKTLQVYQKVMSSSK